MSAPRSRETRGARWLLAAPARLHFGLLSFGRPAGRQFGGAGLMLAQPAVTLALEALPGKRTGENWLTVAGPRAARVRAFAEHWRARRAAGPLPSCRLEVLQLPPEHVGLGSGTALALAVVRLLEAWRGEPAPEPEQLAEWAGRARRSSIGTWGFVTGGLLAEPGKGDGEPLAPLAFRHELPRAWRVLLARHPRAAGLSGSAESHAFERLPPVPLSVTEELERELFEHLSPAAAAGDCEALGESIYRYGRAAGACFAPVQGGPYNGPAVAEMVGRLRAWGVRGVGQSSWGPTVFALFPNAEEAHAARERLLREEPALETRVTAPAARGAELSSFPPPAT